MFQSENRFEAEPTSATPLWQSRNGGTKPRGTPSFAMRAFGFGMATLGILGLGATTYRSAQPLSSASSDVDMYVMAMSYQPEFCYEHRYNNYPGCLDPRDEWKSQLTIHGLWPQYSNGSWPATCSNEQLLNSTITPIQDDMEEYWPNVEAMNSASEEYYDFWKHEWSKHGTCSGLDQSQYFKAALSQLVPTPSMVGENYGGSVSKSDLLEAYGDDLVLVCKGTRYLSEVRVCVGRESNGQPSGRIPCPSTVTDTSSCQGDEIYIDTFPDASA